MKIAVTTFFSESYQELANITIPPLQKWCDKYGYYLNINKISNTRSPHFVKTADARRLLDECDVVMAIECDVLITNMNFEIEDTILGGSPGNGPLYMCKDVNGINSGVFVATQGAKRVLEFVNLCEGSFFDEQNVFQNEVVARNITILNHPSINSIPYEYYKPDYGYIHLDRSKYIPVVPTHPMGSWRPGDFCCHLPGKTLEERIRIFKEIQENIA